jgi:alpha-galactosidase
MRLELEGADATLGVAVGAEVVDGTVHWSVANETTGPLHLDRVRLRWRLESSGTIRMLCHGWQSWSPTGGGVVGVDRDVSLTADMPRSLRAAYHADAELAAADELRSELVTVVADDDDACCIGFDGGERHDGTIRVTRDAVVVEAVLGGAELAPDERRVLHDIRLAVGAPSQLLDDWARWAGTASRARAAAPFRVGWCSWYQYFHGITEETLRANLVRAAEWPIDVFQLDDGYQSAIGDWLDTADSFPASLERLAADITAAGYVPGLWLAPFLASPTSRLATEHPERLARRASGRPVIGMINPGWGGETLVLDTTHPEVVAHLERLARTLVKMGWHYLKLDFTYAPAFPGRWYDPTRTPAQRVRAGYDAIRRGAGDATFILGCGAPLGPCIGAVDGMRIGPDVAPWWQAAQTEGGYPDSVPATKNATRNTLARSFQHRRLWLNDPDCVMLRTSATQLSAQQIETWATVVAASGGMVLLSDDLSLLGERERRLFDDVVATARAVDSTAMTGAAPSCPDLLDRWTPTRLDSVNGQLIIDPDAGRVTAG